MKLPYNTYDRNKLKLIFFFIPTFISTLAIFQGDTTLAPPIIEKSLSLLNWLCFVLLLFFCDFRKSYTPYIVVVAVMVFFMRNFNVPEGVGLGFSGVLMLLLMYILSLFKQDEMYTLIQWFRKAMVVMAALGIIASLDFLIGFGLPHEMVEYYGLSSSIFYVNYHFSYLVLQDEMIRLCGLFNEPGYMGTVFALLLIIERLNFRRFGNVVLLIGGGFTLSLAFFFLLFVGIIIKSFSNKKTFYDFLVFLVLVIVGVAAFDKNGIVTDYIKQQTTFDKQSNSIGGHSREDASFLRVKKEFDKSEPNTKLFGYGSGYCQLKGVEKTASLRVMFVEWGYLGSILIYGALILSGYMTTKRNKNAIIFLLCFVLSIFQRPYVFTTVYFLLLYGGIYYIRHYDGIERQKLLIKN